MSALQSPYAVSVLQIVAGVAALQIMNGTNPLTTFVATKMTELSEELLEAAKTVIFDSPVIAISAGLTYLVQEFATPKIPSLNLSMPGCTALKVTLFVAGTLALRSALSRYLDRTTIDAVDFNKLVKNPQKLMKYAMNQLEQPNKQEEIAIVGYLRQSVVRNAVPIAAACTAAYYAGVPLKLAQTALYTAALIPVVKLLGKGFETFLNLELVKNKVGKVISWIEQQE